jgi:GGDEF domain-containing protein
MIRKIDLLCRLGGDEFVIVMPGTGLHGGREIAERIRAAIASDGFAVAAGGRPIAVTVSAGLAESARDSSAALLRRADRALSDGRLADGAIGNCGKGPAKRERDAPTSGHRTSWKLPLVRGGEAVTAMIGG